MTIGRLRVIHVGRSCASESPLDPGERTGRALQWNGATCQFLTYRLLAALYLRPPEADGGRNSCEGPIVGAHFISEVAHALGQARWGYRIGRIGGLGARGNGGRTESQTAGRGSSHGERRGAQR